MLALRLHCGAVRLDDNYAGEPRVSEARIRVTRAGVCATDLELARGYMAFDGVLGHEFVGVVDQSPDSQWLGRRVVGDINAGCGACPTCARGLHRHCPNRSVLGILGRDGAFADHLWLPVANLHAVPDAVCDAAAAFAEPLAAACEILEQVHIHPADRVVVVGAGRLGHLCAAVLRLTGAQVTAVARGEKSLARLPADVGHCLAADADALAGADVVVDCTGDAKGLELALRLVRPRGTLVLKTTVAGAHQVSLAPVVIDEMTVVGSRCGSMAAALRLLERGLVDPLRLIDAVLPLDQAEDALRLAAQPGVCKVQLTMAA